MSRPWYETDEILERFRIWLAEAGEELPTPDRAAGDVSAAAARAADAPSADVGLLQVVEAFTALRHELKLQTKSARGLEEVVQAALAGLDKSVAQFQAVQARETQAAEQAAKPLVLSLIELDEALERGAKAIALIDRRIADRAPQELLEALDRRFAGLSVWRRWLSAGWHHAARQVCQQHTAETHARMFSALMDGYQLICTRLQRTLAEHQIRRIECVGHPVDPTRMMVVELIDDPQVAPETAVAEFRPGYTWRGAVVRFAEVRAVRRERFVEPEEPGASDEIRNSYATKENRVGDPT